MEETKKWWQSKIVWINTISVLIEIAQMLMGFNVLPIGTLTIGVNILTIIFRFLSKTKLEK